MDIYLVTQIIPSNTQIVHDMYSYKFKSDNNFVL